MKVPPVGAFARTGESLNVEKTKRRASVEAQFKRVRAQQTRKPRKIYGGQKPPGKWPSKTQQTR
jgi:hypothetical protein